MQGKPEPDPRFKEFEEQFNSEGKAIGFKIPKCDFLFTYDETGGWVDEQGNYFNADGVLEPKEEDNYGNQHKEQDEDEEDIGDDEILDQFQKMLQDEEHGIVKKEVASKSESKPYQDYEELIQRISKEEVRTGIPEKCSIYFKMRSKFYERIEPIVQKRQSVADKNAEVKNILEKISKTRQGLLASNPQLAASTFFLSFSGTTLNESIYDRYWYGYLLVDLKDYIPSLKIIEKSKEFALLDDKNYYALKSRLYAKKKMIKTVQDFKKQVQQYQEGKLVKVSFNNLPTDFPLSLIYDLADLCGAQGSEIIQASINDESSATVLCTKAAALKFTNIQGYVHDQNEFIWLQFQKTEAALNPASKFINIGISSQNYKIHERQLYDTLALTNSRQEVAKIYSPEQSKQLQFKICVGGQQALRKILMWRGQSLDVTKIKYKE